MASAYFGDCLSLSFMGHLNLPLFMVVRVAIPFLKVLGMSWRPTLTFSIAKFHALVSQHTLFMSTGMCIPRVITWPRLMNWCYLHSVLITHLANSTPDKSVLGLFFSFFIFIVKATSRVWQRFSVRIVNEVPCFHGFSKAILFFPLEDSLPSWYALLILSSIFGPLKGLSP